MYYGYVLIATTWQTHTTSRMHTDIYNVFFSLINTVPEDEKDKFVKHISKHKATITQSQRNRPQEELLQLLTWSCKSEGQDLYWDSYVITEEDV